MIFVLGFGPAALRAGELSEQDVQREYGYVAVKDGTRLAYVVWRLKKIGQYPTILYYSAYADSAVLFDKVKRYLEAGYAYVGANVRGTGSSEGTVPTMIVHGWQDEWMRPNGVLRLFKLSRSEHKRLIVQNGPHGLNRYTFTAVEEMRWLDRWVKGTRNGVDAEPPVKILWEVAEPEDGDAAMPGWTTTYRTWPVPDLQWLTFHLTATGELTPEKPGGADAQGVRSYVYPLGTELAGSNEQFFMPPYPLGSLSYRTAPMESDTVLLGAPQLTFYFSADSTDTDFMFTLKDIDPLGNTLFIQRTLLRASLRAVDQRLSTPDDIIQSFTKVDLLTPGEVTEAKLSLSAVSHVVRKGHRLELSILAPNSTPAPVWGFLATSAPSVNRIHHGGQFLSQLRLPVVPGEKAQKPAPALGTLSNQPYRPAGASWFCLVSSSASRRCEQ